MGLAIDDTGDALTITVVRRTDVDEQGRSSKLSTGTRAGQHSKLAEGGGRTPDDGQLMIGCEGEEKGVIVGPRTAQRSSWSAGRAISHLPASSTHQYAVGIPASQVNGTGGMN